MELFDKIYGCYYQVVAKILAESSVQPISRDMMQDIVGQYGFEESALVLCPIPLSHLLRHFRNHG